MINGLHLMHVSDDPRNTTSPAHLKQKKTKSHMTQNDKNPRVYKASES